MNSAKINKNVFFIAVLLSGSVGYLQSSSETDVITRVTSTVPKTHETALSCALMNHPTDIVKIVLDSEGISPTVGIWVLDSYYLNNIYSPTTVTPRSTISIFDDEQAKEAYFYTPISQAMNLKQPLDEVRKKTALIAEAMRDINNADYTYYDNGTLVPVPVSTPLPLVEAVYARTRNGTEQALVLMLLDEFGADPFVKFNGKNVLHHAVEGSYIDLRMSSAVITLLEFDKKIRFLRSTDEVGNSRYPCHEERLIDTRTSEGQSVLDVINGKYDHEDALDFSMLEDLSLTSTPRSTRQSPTQQTRDAEIAVIQSYLDDPDYR